MPSDTAFIDLLRYTRFNFDSAKPGPNGVTSVPSYVAFVVTREGVGRVEFGPAAPIEAVVAGWLAAITQNAPAGDFPATLRRLVWDKLVVHLPVGVSAVYLAPDQALTRVPWAALPGATPGTVLLEEHALVAVPHGQFLLAQLTAPAVPPTAGVTLTVGGVEYGDAPAQPPAADDADDLTAKRASCGVWLPARYRSGSGADR